MPGILYKFENQSLKTDKDIFKFEGDLPFAAYFDFETPTTPCNGFNFEDSEVYPVSYCIIFAFHPKLNIDRMVILRRFGRTLDQLTAVSYLSSDILKNLDSITAEQLKDCPINVSKKKNKYAISEKFASVSFKKRVQQKI